MDLGIIEPDADQRFPPADLRRAALIKVISGVPIQVGLHAGPVIFQEGDCYGQTVNLASRVADYASAGEVVVSRSVVDAADGSLVAVRPVGPVELKGVAEALDCTLRAGR